MAALTLLMLQALLMLQTASALADRKLLFGTNPPATQVPVILDMDANYDDTLALLYVAKNPLFDLRAITTSGAGFATHHGGPANMLKLLSFLGIEGVPVSFGPPESLSPVTTFPLQWRIEIDLFYENEGFPEAETPMSMYDSPALIAKTLRASSTKVAVVVTGPATNVAIALRDDPSLLSKISAFYMMGSNYGGGPNNVYDWQMLFNGVHGSCSEDALAHSFTPGSYPLNSAALGYPQDQHVEFVEGTGPLPNRTATRPGCRGVDLSAAGDTEWNVFLDALAWHVVSRMVAEADDPPMFYALATGASETMAVTIADFEAGTATMGDAALAGFVNRLAASFLFAGEAKWWDAATVVSLAELISGYDDGAGTSDSGVCTEWSATDGFAVSLTWNANADADNKLPYGSVVPKPAIGPAASFCVAGSSDNMQAAFWATLAGQTPETHSKVADPSIWLANA